MYATGMFGSMHALSVPSSSQIMRINVFTNYKFNIRAIYFPFGNSFALIDMPMKVPLDDITQSCKVRLKTCVSP